MRYKKYFLAFVLTAILSLFSFRNEAHAVDIAGVCSSVLESFAGVQPGGGSDNSGGGSCTDHGCGCYSGVGFAFLKFSDASHSGTVGSVSISCGSEYDGAWVLFRRQSGTNCNTRNSLFRVATISNIDTYGGTASYYGSGLTFVNANMSGLYEYDINVSLNTVKGKCEEADTNGYCSSIFSRGSSYSWFCANYNPQPSVTYDTYTEWTYSAGTDYYSNSETATASPYVSASISGVSADSTSNGTTYYTAPKTETFPKTYTVNLQYGGRRSDSDGSPSSASLWFSALNGSTEVTSGRVGLAYSATNSYFAYSNGTQITSSGTIRVDWRDSTDTSYPSSVCGTMKMKDVTYTYYYKRPKTDSYYHSCTQTYVNGVASGSPTCGTWNYYTTTYDNTQISVDTSYPHTSGYTITDGTERSTTACATIRGPEQEKATFSGDVYVNPSTLLSGTVTANSETNSLQGDGLHSGYGFDVTYRINRTNSTPSSATSQYAYASGATYPTTPAYTSIALSNGNHDDVAGNTSSPHYYFHNVDIDGSATLCFKLSYDSEVVYRNTSVASRNFAGRQQTCVTVTNPAKSYSTTFTGSSQGWLNSHDRFILSGCDSSNHCSTGIINNSTQQSDGSYQYTYPSDSNYYATFIHKIKRTDANNPVFTLPTNTGTSWEIQQQVDGGAWTTVSGASSTCGTSSCSPSLTYQNAETDVYNHTDVRAAILSSNNKGKYATYCQRLHYYNTVSYKTVTNTADRSGYNVARQTPTGEAYTNAVCLTLKNPRWDETETPDWPSDPENPDETPDQPEPSDPYNPGTTVNEQLKAARTHTIRVTSNTPTLSFQNGSAVNTGGENYSAAKVDVRANFDHQLVRTDNDGASGGFDESDTTIVTATGTETMNFFAGHGSMYGGGSSSAFTVDSNFNGRESIQGRSEVLCKSPIPNSQAVCSPYGLNDFFVATNKNSNTTWNSSGASGRTYTQFNVSASRDLYTVRAGESTRVCQTTYNIRTAWKVRYVDVMRRETYVDGNGNTLTQSGAWTYNRTQLKSRQAEATTPVDFVSSPRCANLQRDWNFEIRSAEPNNVENVHSSAQTISTTFNVEVGRDSGWTDGITRDFITDVDSQVSIIAFVVKEGADRGQITSATNGGTFSGTDFCSFYSAILDSPLAGAAQSCQIIAPRNSDGKLRGHSSEASSNGVYTDTSYTVGFDTGDISVPTIPVGDKFCIAIGIHRRSSTSTESFISRSTCTNLSKRPAFHVWGGSVESFGGIKTSLTQIDEQDSDTPKKSYGSWTDLAIIANKPVTRMSSGDAIVASFADPNLIVPCSVSPLTIANKQCAESLNNLPGEAAVAGASSMIDKLVARYVGGDTTYEGSVGTSITIDGSFFAREEVSNKLGITDSQRIEGVDPLVIISHGSVNINTNLKLNPNMRYSGVHVPQVIIIADGNINIADNVEQVDAWILSRGELDTCTTASGGTIQLSATTCEKALRINGPVIASKIYFKRTFGADVYQDLVNNVNIDEYYSNIRSPGELINLSPAAYLFGVNESQKSGQPRVTYIRELAPRY
ncbi:hypothetical protein IJ380_01290 [Candidatus Saccharibacteria bacterium]|nr:hypothetical protein [Candidatus Saccharibacteria bacterium]